MAGTAENLELAGGSIFADRYQIEQILGRGGMGVVYRATDLTLGENVALKLVPCDAQEHPEAAQRFRQEVRLSRRVTHPNVIRVHDLGEHSDTLYMTMELIVGRTLQNVVRNEAPMAVHRAVELVRTVAVALGAAHAAGIIHRDLKPTNVLIEEATGRIVLSDFGIARLLQEDLGLTQGIVGTMSYMAPEQALNGHVDERTDLYSLGIVFYEMLLGERPTGPSTHVTARLARESGRIPPRLMDLLIRCLAVDAALRPESAAAFVAALDALDHTDPDVTRDEDATMISAGKDLVPFPRAKTTIPPGAPTGFEIDVVSAAPMSPLEPLGPPVSIPPQKLAVLPFRYRGASEHDYLGDVLTDELVDAMSRTRGLLVFGSGATERFRTSRDPIAIGFELSANAVIDGTIQAIGDRVRVAVRLVATNTGLQRLALQYEGRIAEVFDFQETIVRRVAEELRLELVTMAHAKAAASEVVDLYLEARRELRNPDPVSSVRAVALLDRAIVQSPDFLPAIAAHALACTRSWFLAQLGESQAWAERTAASVSRACTYASHIAESHLAEGMFRANLGEYRPASAALQRALELAPACAPVHEYVGMLQCEAGHITKGLEHLDLTAEIDPSRPLVWANIARVRSLLGDRKGATSAMQRLETLERPDRFQASVVLRVRDALWHSDAAALDEWLLVLETSANNLNNTFFQMYVAALQEYDDAIRALAQYPFELDASVSPRFRMATFQWAAEVLMVRNRPDLALEAICGAATKILLDVFWLEKCPLLAPLRPDYAFLESLRMTRERAAAITPF